MSYQATYNPITYRLSRFIRHRYTIGGAIPLCCAAAAFGIVMLVQNAGPTYYAGDLTIDSARNVARRAVVNRYGITRALTFTYRGTTKGHVLGRSAWIARWTIPSRPADVCVYIWGEDRGSREVSYQGRCPS